MEAGWSPGALRHYFATQSELLAFAMRLVVERVEARVAALEDAADPRDAVERVLRELLPLDDERRAENEVWLAFTARALIDPRLRAQHDEVHGELRPVCANLVERLALPATARPGRAPPRAHRRPRATHRAAAR